MPLSFSGVFLIRRFSRTSYFIRLEVVDGLTVTFARRFWLSVILALLEAWKL